MANALGKIPTKISQVRRLVVRAELTLSALQIAVWIALVTISLGAVLLLRPGRRPRFADDTAAIGPPGSSAEADKQRGTGR